MGAHNDRYVTEGDDRRRSRILGRKPSHGRLRRAEDKRDRESKEQEDEATSIDLYVPLVLVGGGVVC